MKRRTLIIILILFFVLIGIVFLKTNNRLTENDIKFNPYQVGDTLFFQSDRNEKDTLIIYSLDRRKLNEKCYSFLTCIYTNIFYETLEGYYINTTAPNKTWTGNSLITIRAEKDNYKTIYFDLYVDNACWYGDSETDLDKIRLYQTTSFNTEKMTINDVIVIVSENKDYVDRDDYIKRLYWSKTLGIVGFDKLNGDKWLVVKK